uniref:Uncharacterized protein n=1 Tax=Romanomermis culicivorax TaxID=13658 RepID=A0A915KKF5_ROMCU
MDFRDIVRISGNPEKLMEFLQKNNLIFNKMTCKTCSGVMNMVNTNATYATNATWCANPSCATNVSCANPKG